MSKKPSLAESMRTAVKTPSSEPISLPPASIVQGGDAKSAGGFYAATRIGKKKVTAPLTPEDHKRLRHLALDREATTEALLVEAINDLFIKYGLVKAEKGRDPP